jgi:hypothetical protein
MPVKTKSGAVIDNGLLKKIISNDTLNRAFVHVRPKPKTRAPKLDRRRSPGS